MYYSNDQTLNTLIASASVDSTVRIWKRQSDFNLNANFSCEQVISCKMNGFALALKLYLLPLSNCNFFFEIVFEILCFLNVY